MELLGVLAAGLVLAPYLHSLGHVGWAGAVLLAEVALFVYGWWLYESGRSTFIEAEHFWARHGHVRVLRESERRLEIGFDCKVFTFDKRARTITSSRGFRSSFDKVQEVISLAAEGTPRDSDDRYYVSLSTGAGLTIRLGVSDDPHEVAAVASAVARFMGKPLRCTSFL